MNNVEIAATEACPRRCFTPPVIVNDSSGRQDAPKHEVYRHQILSEIATINSRNLRLASPSSAPSFRSSNISVCEVQHNMCT